MKEKSDIKSILGLSQNEMAILLGIPRSNWAMFKSGQRDIPLSAKEKLTHLVEASYKRKKNCHELEIFISEELKNEKTILKQELQTIELKLKRVSAEIEKLKQTREKLFAAFETAVFLLSENVSPKTNLLAETIKKRVINSLNKYNLASVTALQLKKENLAQLKTKIEEKLKG